MNLRNKLIYLAGIACLLSLTAHADLTGTLYFTTYGGGNNVHSVGFDYVPNTSR